METIYLPDLKGKATSEKCAKCGALVQDGTTCAYPEECFWDGRTTSDGLLAVYNSRLQVWQYFRLTKDGYQMTGSTEHFEG
jgi:hypothetical protein